MIKTDNNLLSVVLSDVQHHGSVPETRENNIQSCLILAFLSFATIPIEKL